MGQKTAQVHCTLTDKQASAYKRTAMAMELHVESHKDYLHYKIMSKMGDSEIAREAKALKKSSPPTTIKFRSNILETLAVSSAEVEAELAGKGNEPPKSLLVYAVLVFIASLGSTSNSHKCSINSSFNEK